MVGCGNLLGDGTPQAGPSLHPQQNQRHSLFAKLARLHAHQVAEIERARGHRPRRNVVQKTASREPAPRRGNVQMMKEAHSEESLSKRRNVVISLREMSRFGLPRYCSFQTTVCTTRRRS